MACRKRCLSNDADARVLHREWDEASCPICVDHPHNAVLLLCSSYEMGCRSYICDTSYRHSNCLDRFKSHITDSNNSVSSLNASSDGTLGLSSSDPTEARENNSVSEGNSVTERGPLQARGHESPLEGFVPLGVNVDYLSKTTSSFRCPLCRGNVLGWKVDEEARTYLNLKPRSCSHESCTFSGSYRDLRQHARRVHPMARPRDIDPSRQRAWQHLEHQREYGDIVSAIRSAIPGAIVYGDYVIENGDNRQSEEQERTLGESSGSWLPMYVFQMFGSMNSMGMSSLGRSRTWSQNYHSSGSISRRSIRTSGSRHSRTFSRRSTGTLSRRSTRTNRRRYLWGENLLGLRYDDDEDKDEDEDSDLNIGENVPSNPRMRRRRRLTHFRSDEDQ